MSLCLRGLAMAAFALLLAAAPAQAQIALRGASSAGQSSPSGGGLTISKPAGTVSGDVMVASLAVRPIGATIGTPTGWTLLRTTTVNVDVTQRLATFYKVAGGSEPASYLWALGGTAHTGAVGGVIAFSGVDNAGPIDVEGGNTTAFGYSHTANSVTTTVANTRLVATYAFTSTASSWTPPAGMTESVDAASEPRPASPGMSMEMSHQARATVGATGSRTATASSPGTDQGYGTAHMLALAPVPPPVNHYELSLPSTSLACLPTTVTVTACANSSSPCSSAVTTVSGATATLATSGATLGATSVSFNASGVATTTLSYPGAANGASVSVTLSGESSAAASSRQCCPNGSSCSVANSCSSTFNTAGFIVAASANGTATTIPAQTAGTASGNFVLRAVKTSTTTKACEAALSGAAAVNWAYECNNPATCSASNLMSLNGGSATTIQRNNNASVASYTSVAMSFDANGNAPFSFTFSDVGQATLWASKTVNSAPLAGSSNAFVTKPAGFTLSAVQQTASPNLANPAAASAAGARFVKAGEAFRATVTAVTAGGAATPNFGKETSPEGVLLTRALVLPGGGATGTLSNATIAGGSFTSGAATVSNLAFSEVGIITLTPSVADADYLGAGNVTGTTSGNVGRFVPAQFVLSAASVTHRSGLSCSPASNFSYLGENFRLSFTLTAQNTAATTTQNYSGSFAKFDPSSAASYNLAGRAGTTAFSTGGGRLALGSASGSWSNGVAAALAVTLQATRATTAEGPFDADFGIAPVDSDGAAMAAFDLASSSGGALDLARIGTVALRYGRLQLLNAIGAADRPLSLPVRAQYWNGSAWALYTLDSCTTVAASAVSFGNLRRTLTTADTAVSAGVALAAGAGTLRLAAPGGGRSGTVDVALSLGSSATDASCLQAWTPGSGDAATAGANLAYLRGAWCGSNQDKDPAARATFGQPRTLNHLLYRREIY